MDCSPPGSSVRGLLQARILEWVAILFSGGSSWPRDRTQDSCIAGRLFTTEPLEKPYLQLSESLMNCPWLKWKIKKNSRISFWCNWVCISEEEPSITFRSSDVSREGRNLDSFRNSILFFYFFKQNTYERRICLPVQETRVRTLVWEDLACCGATKPLSCNYWACALEPGSHNCRSPCPLDPNLQVKEGQAPPWRASSPFHHI